MHVHLTLISNHVCRNKSTAQNTYLFFLNCICSISATMLNYVDLVYIVVKLFHRFNVFASNKMCSFHQRKRSPARLESLDEKPVTVKCNINQAVDHTRV